jgi:hypothetical protein
VGVCLSACVLQYRPCTGECMQSPRVPGASATVAALADARFAPSQRSRRQVVVSRREPETGRAAQRSRRRGRQNGPRLPILGSAPYMGIWVLARMQQPAFTLPSPQLQPLLRAECNRVGHGLSSRRVSFEIGTRYFGDGDGYKNTTAGTTQKNRKHLRQRKSSASILQPMDPERNLP